MLVRYRPDGTSAQASCPKSNHPQDATAANQVGLPQLPARVVIKRGSPAIVQKGYQPKLAARATTSRNMPPRQPLVAECVRDLLHVGRISKAGLAKLLKILRDKNVELDSIAKSGVINAAFLEHAKSLGISQQMPMEGGGHADWFFLDPNALLAHIVAKSPELQHIFREANV